MSSGNEHLKKRPVEQEVHHTGLTPRFEDGKFNPKVSPTLDHNLRPFMPSDSSIINAQASGPENGRSQSWSIFKILTYERIGSDAKDKDLNSQIKVSKREENTSSSSPPAKEGPVEEDIQANLIGHNQIDDGSAVTDKSTSKGPFPFPTGVRDPKLIHSLNLHSVYAFKSAAKPVGTGAMAAAALHAKAPNAEHEPEYTLRMQSMCSTGQLEYFFFTDMIILVINNFFLCLGCVHM